MIVMPLAVAPAPIEARQLVQALTDLRKDLSLPELQHGGCVVVLVETGI